MSETARPFEFDEQIHEVSFPATTLKGGKKTVFHRLRKPSLEELNNREGQIKHETIKINARETEIKTDQRAADAWLWGRIVQAVKCYGRGDDWQELSEDEKGEFNSSHKSDAIAFLYSGKSEIDGEDDYVPIGPADWTVKQEIGANAQPDFIVRHILRVPTAEERLRYSQTAFSKRYLPGAKREQSNLRGNLKAHIELYDALIQRIEGGTVAGQVLSASNRREFLAAIDPIWKRDIVQTLIAALEAQMPD
jgi:hypothetical protein